MMSDKNITEDKHEVSSFIKNAKKPLIILGQSSLKSKSAKYIFESIKLFLKKMIRYPVIGIL